MAGPRVLKVVIPFADPVIVGRFVYHCRAVDHEDKGMMGSSRSSPDRPRKMVANKHPTI